MVNGTKPAQLTASGLEPVLKPATCRRPARMASSWAALLCTGKNCTFLPVTLDRCWMKPSQIFAYTAGSSTGV